MGSDKARITFDEKQQYRSVIMQQGRVTLEADWNEAQEIASEDLSKDALDFVGPAGTPDDGYRVSSLTQPKFDLGISAGTMYVGGERVELDKDLSYSDQTDWLDRFIDPDWIDLAKIAQQPPAHEFVYLFLREQEVSAVEDSALRDVALGGPDTAARRRLIQHIVRAQVKGSDCAAGLKETRDHWKQQGLHFDPANMRLVSDATLELGFSKEQPQPNPCEPSSQGGYLGADNQLIRVQVSNASAPKLLWGYDNASFLYRVDVRNTKTLALQSAPVDAFHEPRTGQAVEVLLAAARLSNGEYVAAHSGFVTTVASYSRDGQELTLAKPLPAVYGDGDPKHPKPDRVFLRVWQEELPFTAGATVALTQTGLTVKLKSSTGSFHLGDFWQIAARPATPTKVYPERYLHGPQPPDGPRMWACPLAVVNRSGNTVKIGDCRNPFDNLVELTKRKLGGCCTITLRPQDAGDRKFQAVIDSLKGKGPAKICLTPGVYLLRESLLLNEGNSGLIIEACPGKAILRAANSEATFSQGMLILNRADNVTVRGLSFELPEGRVSDDQKDPLASLTVSIGIRPLHCNGLTVEECEFFFPTTVQKQTLFGVGIFAASQCAELRICGNRFIGGNVDAASGRALGVLRNPPLRLIVGFMHTPAFVPAKSTLTTNLPSAMFLRASLQSASIQRNYFERLTAASLILADSGSLAISENQVQECYAGFWILALATLLANANPQTGAGNQATDVSKAIMSAVALIAWDQIMSVTVLAALKYPLPADFDLVKAGAVKQAAKAPTVTESTLLNNAVDVMRVHFTGDAKASAADAKVVEVDAQEFARPGFTAGVNAAQAEIFPDFAEAVFGFAAAAFQHQLSLSLDFSHNDVSTVLQKLPWSTSVLIVDTDQVTDSQLTMSSNRLRSQSTSATAGVLFVNRCTVTGNVIFNELIEEESLFLVAPSDTQKRVLPLTAITGNVFRGKPSLIAPRPVFTPPAPKPMDTWEFFNTKV